MSQPSKHVPTVAEYRPKFAWLRSHLGLFNAQKYSAMVFGKRLFRPSQPRCYDRRDSAAIYPSLMVEGGCRSLPFRDNRYFVVAFSCSFDWSQRRVVLPANSIFGSTCVNSLSSTWHGTYRRPSLFPAIPAKLETTANDFSPTWHCETNRQGR